MNPPKNIAKHFPGADLHGISQFGSSGGFGRKIVRE